MPEMDGISAAAVLRTSTPQSAVVLLSIYDDVITRARADEAEVAGFVHKSGEIDVLIATIRRAAEQKKT